MFFRNALFPIGLLMVLASIACQLPPGVGTGDLPSEEDYLSQQLNDAERLNLESAQNQINQARHVYFNLSGRLLQTTPVDVLAFQAVRNEVLPAMLAAANALVSLDIELEQGSDLRTEYQTLFSDSSSQMLNGINNNLAIYQNFIEAPQSLDGMGVRPPDEVLIALSDLFQATELMEQYVAELSQFQGLLQNGTRILNGIRNQQNVVINGVLTISGRIQDPEALQKAYLTLVQSLTRPELLSQLAQLARRTFGDSHVALNQSELSAVQPNPNLLQMVVQEDEHQYRVIRVLEGRLQNELRTDMRGLSAADLLNESNVVVVREPSL